MITGEPHIIGTAELSLLKVVSSLILEAKNRPEAEAVEVAYQALVQDYPCN
jgi:hypothetical protein